ncbi:hypothetical protein [Azospirillum sp. SYSU D00513]|uniref:hypothetical protein n=1 Tax=Azospirillum sp. SYSU D00513 TaxID=2812561 RepID=UPI001A95E044|nr:hypothetical protein [Azospirillum sp. SYSU D00513]
MNESFFIRVSAMGSLNARFHRDFHHMDGFALDGLRLNAAGHVEDGLGRILVGLGCRLVPRRIVLLPDSLALLPGRRFERFIEF